MAEPVTYASVPKSRPRINRDWTAAVLALVAIGPFIVEPLVEWVQGRLNSEEAGWATFCFFSLVYLVAGVALLIRVLIYFLAGTAMQRVRWIVLLALVTLPFWPTGLLTATLGRIGGYGAGFARWATSNVDAKAIRQWGASVPMDATRGTEHPDYWMGDRLPGILFVPVAKADWPLCVTRADPKNVYVLSDRSAVILHWPASSQRWSRAVVIAANTAWSPPPQWFSPFTNTGQGVWACVRGPM